MALIGRLALWRRAILPALGLSLTLGCSAPIQPASWAPQLPLALSTSAAKQYYFYVGSAPAKTEFDVFPLEGSAPIRQFSRPHGIRAMAIDPWGDIYTSDGDPDQGRVIAYTPGGNSHLLSIRSPAVQAIAFDTTGHLFATNSVVVEEYAARSTKLIRNIGTKTSGADALAVDSNGTLFVGRVNGSVEVFAQGSSSPFLTITSRLRAAFALLLDAGTLYVANCPSCYNIRHATDSVNEYDSSTGALIRSITTGINHPGAIAIGKQGDLFVANDPFLKSGAVTVYGSNGKLLHTVTHGIDGPDALSVGPFGDVYVSNWCGCGEKQDSISVYDADGSRLLRQITQGITAPGSLAIGSKDSDQSPQHRLAKL